MGKISVSIYGLNFNKHVQGGTQQFFIDDVLGTSAKDHLFKFLEDNSTTIQTLKSKTFKVTLIEDLETYKDKNGVEVFDYIFGTVESGTFGYKSKIVNPDSQEISYMKPANEAEAIPFFFMFCFPRVENNERVLVVLQNNGNYSIKGVLEGALKDFVKTQIDRDLFVNFGTLVPQTYLERYLSGEVENIIATRFAKTQDITDSLNHAYLSERISMVVHKPKLVMPIKQRVKAFFNGTGAFDAIIEIPNFPYDNLKLETKVGRGKKTIDINNTEKLSLREEIDETVQIIDGHPEITGFRNFCRETAYDYLIEMGTITAEL